MKYEVVTMEKKIIVGKSVRTTNENSKAMSDIGGIWEEFINKRLYEMIKNRINERAIGLYTDYESDATKPYTFMCGCEVSESTNDTKLESRIINSGKYAKFLVKGDIREEVGKAWYEIWSMDLDRKYDSDYEVYHNDSDDMTNQTIEIFISLN